MSDRLRQALKQIELRGARVASQAADDGIGTDLTKALAAARRFLALTETGPDYRAAAVEWLGEDPPAEFKGNWDDMIAAVIEQTVKPVVDAALAGYLTEEGP